ncbi:uncharacterized protein LOC118503129 [Anopheles stephensi]|uniref:uncharacterized protein LOC118503129 n=1 Tax=Anopheles stephensi TaxID=30069 RepID=UPI0016589AA6|nr:uncharacterized protein LOC118503129 [Anopheles stephensi]
MMSSELDHAQPSSAVHTVTIRSNTHPGWNFASQNDVARFIALVQRYPKLQSRISPERLLPEWEKLVPVTGLSAKEMCLKWKRLCDRYRTELRREMITPPAEFKSKWAFFVQMSFVRETELKRIRLIKGKQNPQPPPMKREPHSPTSPIPMPAWPTSPKRKIAKQQRPLVVPMKCFKAEPVSPSAGSTLIAESSQRSEKPPMASHGGDSESPSCSRTKPSPMFSSQKQAACRKLIPIEQMPSTGRVKVVGSAKQNFLKDLQEQAGRAVALRRPVHRAPITDSLRVAPDNDYDFLMIRIYPLLGLVPVAMKPICYERVQQYLFQMSDVKGKRYDR